MPPPKLPGKSELRQVLETFRRIFLFVALFSFCINLLMLAPSLYMLQVYDRVLTSGNVETLLMLTLITVFFYAILSLLELMRSQTLVRLSNKLDARLNRRVFEAGFQRNLRAAGGNPAQALSDLANVRQFLTGNGIFALCDAPWFPIYVMVVFMLHPWLGALSLLGALILAGLTLLTEKLTQPPLAEANKELMQANSTVNANLRNAEVIEAMGMLNDIRRRWLQRHRKVMALQSQASDRAGMIAAVTKTVRLLLQSLLLGVGAWLTIQNELTAGVMIVASLLGGRTLAPVEMLIGSWKPLLSARESYGRLTELLRQFPQRPESMELPAPSGRLTVSNLVAVPPGAQRPVLRNLNFEVAAGEVLGVIGPSASGKSSLARLLVGVWAPYNGSVRLDAAEIFHWDKSQLGPYIGYLPQDVELFEGTVAENIARFGKLEADKVTAAARLAGVHEIILHLPKGYDTEIGIGGSVLSGGQRQRIALARALFGLPSLLVLDEPNANLDEAGEVALLNAIREVKACGKTVVLITHRPSVLSVVDRVAVLRDGELAMIGPRDQVMARLRGAAPVPAATPLQVVAGG